MQRFMWFSALAISLTLGSVPASAAQFKLATVAPEGSQWMAELRTGADELKKKTAGRVSLKFYTGGVMGNDKKVLRKMRIGQIHGGAFTSSGLSERYKDVMIYGIPLTFRDQAEVDYVRERMDATLSQGLEDAGFVVLGFAGGGFARLMGGEPVTTVDGLRGRKIWVPEGDQVTYASLNQLSLSPVVLPMTDVLTGLQTGLIDFIATPPVAAVLLQWYTKVSYVIDVPIAYTIGVLVIDQRPFNKLSAEDQALFSEIMGRAYDRVDAASRTDNVSAGEALLENGLKVVQPVDNERDRWDALGRDLRRQLVVDDVVSAAIVAELDGHLDAYRNGGASAAEQASVRPAE
ncbi:MAG: TRAP transporter substrate-binding protein DctP [Chromatiales bacterium]|nr:MAG: TRAP transporter substrate-binding protein DctP [Chromatiales bacterium]